MAECIVYVVKSGDKFDFDTRAVAIWRETCTWLLLQLRLCNDVPFMLKSYIAYWNLLRYLRNSVWMLYSMFLFNFVSAKMFAVFFSCNYCILYGFYERNKVFFSSTAHCLHSVDDVLCFYQLTAPHLLLRFNFFLITPKQFLLLWDQNG